ncbi:MAG: hypothetical protein V4717_22970 [Bacteroidota bacterium]
MKIILVMCLVCATMVCTANTYYVSANGNDDNSGLSIGAAWLTIDKVDSFDLQAGDQVLFEGGQVFSGAIINKRMSNATIGGAITFGSYGGGKAIINSGTRSGFIVEEAGDIIIKDFVFQGAGYMATTIKTSGVYFKMSSVASAPADNIIVDNVEAFGYGGWGIVFETLSSQVGYNHVKVINCSVHDNGIGGLYLDGCWDEITGVLVYRVNTDIYFGNNKAYHNKGRMDYKINWSGSGILLSGVIGGLIEHCEAYDNGVENGSNYAGPVGIFISECKNVIVQYCSSHNNKGGINKRDGGGFDMDGGAESSVIQYCESYENDGAGYGLYNYYTVNKMTHDTVRFNKSTNDGRNPLYGGITFWGSSKPYSVEYAEVYGNTITMNMSGRALHFLNNNMIEAKIHDNIFCVTAPGIFNVSIPSNATVINNTFPCNVLPIRMNSFKVRRIQ